MPVFPVPAWIGTDYHAGAPMFGCRRDNGRRKHAGIDLYAPDGSPVHAIADGVVIEEPRWFYDVVWQVVVQHDGYIARYGEVSKNLPSDIKRGARVREGQVIAYVGKMVRYRPMLHFEMYSGQASGALTNLNNPPYKRRSDLLNPTEFMDGLRGKKPNPAQPIAAPPAPRTPGNPPMRAGGNRGASVSGSVGRSARNRYADVKMVQWLLNVAKQRLAQVNRTALNYPPLREDGICGPRTRTAITTFQRAVAGFRLPDARVDPGGRTLRMLNAIITGAPSTAPVRVTEVRRTEERRSGQEVSDANASPEQLLTDPRVKAMLEVLAFTEGTGDNYGKVVNGVVIASPLYPQYVGQRNVTVTDLSRHPRIMVRWATGQKPSSAAGRYQFLQDTWGGLGQPDFGRHSQDIGAIILMKRRNMVAPLLRGDLDRAVFNGAPEWASLPKNASNQGYYSGQSARTLAQIRAKYEEALTRFRR